MARRIKEMEEEIEEEIRRIEEEEGEEE